MNNEHNNLTNNINITVDEHNNNSEGVEKKPNIDEIKVNIEGHYPNCNSTDNLGGKTQINDNEDINNPTRKINI